MAALEAVIHAVEDGTLPLKRVEDALARHRRVKERFLAPPRPLPLTGAALRAAARAATSIRRSPPRWRGSRSRCASLARSGPATASPSSRPPARSRATSSTPASPSCARSASSRSTTRACSTRQRLRRRRRRDVRARGVHARLGRIPTIAALIAVRGGYGSVQLLPLLDRDGDPPARQGVHRLQRQHVAPDLADAAVRHRRRFTGR